VVLVVKLRDRETLADGSGSSGNRGRDRRAWISQVLSLSCAFVVASFVLFFGWDTKERQGAVEAVVSSTVVGPPSPETAPGFDAEALADQLEEIAGGHEGVYGVAVLEPVSGTKISLRGEEEFRAASIGKLPVFVALYRAAARGELDLEEEIPILPEDVQDYGSGELHAFPIGYSLSLRECAYRLVNHSDNTAWAMLDRRLGVEKIRNELEEMGIKSSQYPGSLSAYFTTPNDVLLLLENISDPRYTSEELSEEMLDTLTETAFEDRIPERLPRDVRIAHKTGSYEDNFGDAGVVFYKDSRSVERRYYLVVLARGAGEYDVRDTIQSMSLAVYEALTGIEVDRGWSRGKNTRLESGIDDQPASELGSVENIEMDQENVQRAKPPLGENPLPALQRPPPGEKWSSGSQNNVAPVPPLNSTTEEEPADFERFASVFPESFQRDEEKTELS
jgi:beta-lactamase class A